jgi:hypothetical protein
VRNVVDQRHVQRQRLERNLRAKSDGCSEAQAPPSAAPAPAPRTLTSCAGWLCSLSKRARSLSGRQGSEARHAWRGGGSMCVSAHSKQRAVLVLQPLQQRLLEMRLHVQLPHLYARLQRDRLLHCAQLAQRLRLSELTRWLACRTRVRSTGVARAALLPCASAAVKERRRRAKECNLLLRLPAYATLCTVG